MGCISAKVMAAMSAARSFGASRNTIDTKRDSWTGDASVPDDSPGMVHWACSQSGPSETTCMAPVKRQASSPHGARRAGLVRITATVDFDMWRRASFSVSSAPSARTLHRTVLTSEYFAPRRRTSLA